MKGENTDACNTSFSDEPTEWHGGTGVRPPKGPSSQNKPGEGARALHDNQGNTQLQSPSPNIRTACGRAAGCNRRDPRSGEDNLRNARVRREPDCAPSPFPGSAAGITSGGPVAPF